MKFRTLIVDGDQDFVTLCANKLRRNNEREFYITQALSGNDALDVIARQSFELVLMGDRLPDMSGTQLIGHLRQSELHSTPIILITDSDTPAVIEGAVKRGASACVYRNKTSSGEIVQAVNNLLQASDGHPSLFHSERSDALLQYDI